MPNSPKLFSNKVNDPKARFLLAHGAGAGMDTPFMNAIAEGLQPCSIEVLRFEFPYMEERRRTGKRRPPNRQPDLIECWQRAIDQVSITAPLFIGGKSMGGRMASLIADQNSVAGLVCLGYPFHPSGKPEKLRIDHLQELQTPTLILQGERDTLGNREEVGSYPLSKNITVEWMSDGDHSFKPRKKSGTTLEANLEQACHFINEFVAQKSNTAT